MGQPYKKELDLLGDTYGWVAKQEVHSLQLFLDRWSNTYTVVIGSGGSYSAATAVALFREIAHCCPTTPVTPLEFLSLVERLSPQALLLSAEGKNKDILAAARAAIAADLCSAAITLTCPNPLTQLCESSNAVRAFSFQMDWVKDGYLATNSLLAMVLLLYRAFFGDTAFQRLASLFSPQRLTQRRSWFSEFGGSKKIRNQGVLLLHSEDARLFAVDLESRLSEAALAMVQVTDVRQFAHGRHLQLANPEYAPYVLFAYSKKDEGLIKATAALLPDFVDSFQVEIEGNQLQETIIASLVDAMFFTERLAAEVSYDPGQPDVPTFGRAVHAIDMDAFTRLRVQKGSIVELAAKRKALLSPKEAVPQHVQIAGESYIERLKGARIRAVVCDFDGTLCRAENRFGPISPVVSGRIVKLLQQGMIFAIATGRGDSLQKELVASFEPKYHDAITVGYYSGSYIAKLSQTFERPPVNPEFEELYAWLKTSIYEGICNKNLDEVARGGQLTIRVPSARHALRLRLAIHVWLNASNKADWKVYSSGHSVDVLDSATSKLRVVNEISLRFGLNPNTEILRIGDCGHEEGNDFELLNDGLGLSCDGVSTKLDACWNFAPHGTNQADCLLTYLDALEPHVDGFRISEAILTSTKAYNL